MTHHHSGAASVRASTAPPSIDLVALAKALASAVPVCEGGGEQKPLWSTRTNRVVVDTSAPIKRLAQSPEFRDGFGATSDGGFLRDIVPPRKGETARIGGYIHGDAGADLTSAVQRLEREIEQALDAALAESGMDLSESLLTTGETYLTDLGTSIGIHVPDDAASELTSLVTPLEFVDTTAGRPKAERDRDVARVIAAVEEVDASEWIDRLAKPLEIALTKRDLDEAEIADIVQGLREEARREGSQTHRMQRFIGDDALARARIEVGMAIMGAVREAVVGWASDPGARRLVQYADAVTRLRDSVLSGDVEISIDAGRALGNSAKTTLYAQLVKVGFMYCLPVWPRPETQLFELRSRAAQGERVLREVSYRFRINGRRPDSDKSIFADRIARLRKALLGNEPGEHPRLSQHLAELVFLLAVVPADPDTGEDPETIARSLADRLSSGDTHSIAGLINDLESREPVVQQVAGCLIKALREKGTVIVDRAARGTRDLWVCVKNDIVDWSRAQGSTDGHDIFVRPDGGALRDEGALWFRSVAVTRDPLNEPGVLFSVKASYRLRERTLCEVSEMRADVRTLSGARALDGPLLPVIVAPTDTEGATRDRLKRWLKGASVVVGIDEDWLQRQRSRHTEVATDHKYAASVTATAILLFVTLRALRNRLALTGPSPRLLILRAQSEGRRARRDDGLLSGSHGLFAVSKAVEQALGTEAPVFMQGFALSASASEQRWQEGGTYAALKSAFPIRFSSAPGFSEGPIALISYSTRPCGKDPSGQDGDRHVFSARTYIGLPEEGPTEQDKGLHLSHVRNLAHVQSVRDFENPTILFEEIARLHADGCRHILLLWSHFGARRIGRGANRHAPHANRRFLARLAEEFPDATIYTLSLDTFPAVRVTSRRELKDRYAFEVNRVREHETFWDGAESPLRDDLIAFYSFATLAVVGGERGEQSRPQSGFCTYFLETSAQAGVDLEWSQKARTNLFGQGPDPALREALLALLRGVHYLHAEREPQNGRLRPCLQPHHWNGLENREAAGEVVVMHSRRRGDVVLSLPAVLSRVGDVLRVTRPS